MCYHDPTDIYDQPESKPIFQRLCSSGKSFLSAVTVTMAGVIGEQFCLRETFDPFGAESLCENQNNSEDTTNCRTTDKHKVRTGKSCMTKSWDHQR